MPPVLSAAPRGPPFATAARAQRPSPADGGSGSGGAVAARPHAASGGGSPVIAAGQPEPGRPAPPLSTHRALRFTGVAEARPSRRRADAPRDAGHPPRPGPESPAHLPEVRGCSFAGGPGHDAKSLYVVRVVMKRCCLGILCIGFVCFMNLTFGFQPSRFAFSRRRVVILAAIWLRSDRPGGTARERCFNGGLFVPAM